MIGWAMAHPAKPALFGWVYNSCNWLCASIHKHVHHLNDELRETMALVNPNFYFCAKMQKGLWCVLLLLDFFQTALNTHIMHWKYMNYLVTSILFTCR